MMLALSLLFAMSASLGATQDPFPHVSNDESVIKLINHLKVRLDIHGWPAGCRRPPGPPTRYEEAVFLHAAYRYFIEPKVKHKLGSDYRKLVESVERTASLRTRELASMGVDVEAMKLHLKALTLGEGFPDVPPSHWATKATRELKDRGLLKGYPDGLFRGE